VFLSDDERTAFLSSALQQYKNAPDSQIGSAMGGYGDMSAMFGDQGGLEYLFAQQDKIQITPTNIIARNARTATVSLEIHHPVKEIFFFFRPLSSTNTDLGKEYFKFYAGPDGRSDLGAFKTLKLQLNNQDRFQPLESTVFRWLWSRDLHTRVPRKPIYILPWSLDPEGVDPSGQLNFSVIDQVRMLFEFNDPLPEDMELVILTNQWNTIEFTKLGQAQVRWAM
jgi:hypothetical protein